MIYICESDGQSENSSCPIKEQFQTVPLYEPENIKEQSTAVPLTIQYDMLSQRRASGRAYSSLSGVESMIGHKTGKLIGFGVRCKSCRVCTYWKNKGHCAPEHDCVVNFTGSA